MQVNISELLEQGVSLMLLGMGIVFFILGLLVFLIKAASVLVARYEPVVEQTPTVSGKINDDVIEAITIAVQRFRSK